MSEENKTPEQPTVTAEEIAAKLLKAEQERDEANRKLEEKENEAASRKSVDELVQEALAKFAEQQNVKPQEENTQVEDKTQQPQYTPIKEEDIEKIVSSILRKNQQDTLAQQKKEQASAVLVELTNKFYGSEQHVNEYLGSIAKENGMTKQELIDDLQMNPVRGKNLIMRDSDSYKTKKNITRPSTMPPVVDKMDLVKEGLKNRKVPQGMVDAQALIDMLPDNLK